jgi:thioredoxin 2
MSSPQLIRCNSCGSTNRVPTEGLAGSGQPICGRCKAPLATSTKPVAVTDSTFSAEVERSPLPVLLDVWAPWCGPCRMIGPLVDQLAVEYAGRLRVAKLNLDENPAIAARFNIMSIPALLVFQAGREADRMIGVQPKSEIVRRLERVLAS